MFFLMAINQKRREEDRENTQWFSKKTDTWTKLCQEDFLPGFRL